MNKGQLVEAISRDAKITKAQAQDALDAFVKNIQKSLKGGDKVTIVGFGTFSAAKPAARMGIASASTPAKKVARFSVGRLLRDAVEEGSATRDPLMDSLKQASRYY